MKTLSMRKSLLKQFFIAGLLLAMLILSSVALADGTLAGKYQTTIKSPTQLKGTWGLRFAKDGAYTVTRDGAPFVHGKYTDHGAKITLGHETGEGACAKSGSYTWHKSGKTLRFTRVSDSSACNGREAVLSHAFVQQP
jgi:hypothetical protein